MCLTREYVNKLSINILYIDMEELKRTKQKIVLTADIENIIKRKHPPSETEPTSPVPKNASAEPYTS